MTDHDDAQPHHGPGEVCATDAGDPPAAGGPDPGRAAVLQAIGQECERWLLSRDPLPEAERARTAFVCDKATALARVTGADQMLVAAAALIDGLAVTLHGDSTRDAPRDAPRDAARDAAQDGAEAGPAGDAAAGREIWDDDATSWAARAIQSVLRTVPDRRERARIVEILRDARRHPDDGAEAAGQVPAGVSAEARALHDARTVFALLPFGPIVLAGSRAGEDQLDLAAVARAKLADLTTLSRGGPFYNDVVTSRYSGWAAALLLLWEKVLDAVEDTDAGKLLARLPVGGDPDAARATMVADLVTEGWLTDPVVEQAIATVPRHRFAPPGTPLLNAYATHRVLVTKRGRDGRTMSSVSAPWLQARMIEMAGIGPGSRVVEIGSGGYNAALCAEVVGAGGRVVSVDIDAEVTAWARARLETTGYSARVEVICADATAERVLADGEQADAILVTVGAAEIAPVWLDQLADGGILVVPLTIRGVSLAIAFRKTGGRLVSVSTQTCGLVPMQGQDAHREHQVRVPSPTGAQHEVVLTVDDRGDDGAGAGGAGVVPGPAAVQQAVQQAFAGDPETTWPGVTAAPQVPLTDLFLRCACQVDGACEISAPAGAGLVTATERLWPAAAVQDGSVAYLVSRRLPDGDGAAELGIRSYGHPRAAEQMLTQLRAWNTAQSAASTEAAATEPTFSYTPAGRPPLADAVAAVLPRRHGTLAVWWPPDPEPAASRDTETTTP